MFFIVSGLIGKNHLINNLILNTFKIKKKLTVRWNLIYPQIHRTYWKFNKDDLTFFVMIFWKCLLVDMFIDRVLSPAVFVCSFTFIRLAFPSNAERPMRDGDNSSAHRMPLKNRLRVFNYFKTTSNPEFASQHNIYIS